MSAPALTGTDRRGVLLLLVLSVLTLFLLMGGMLLTIATRARAAARAFSAVRDDLGASAALPRAVLDEALLILIRGSRDTQVRARLTESLLGDMYGQNGNRVPFRDEPFDAFGIDAFLTEFEADGTVKTPAFAAGRAPEVDNDADGRPDGVWLEGVIPAIASPTGGTRSFRVSYLVAELDGRINVNAHGGGGPLGPASIDAAGLPPFRQDSWTRVQQGGQRTAEPAGNALRRSPVIGRAVNGRGGNAYGLRLDREAPRPAALTGQATQNPFTPGELERVLRPFDSDCSTLPPRLAALLEDLDGSARLLVTTDSWDTTNRKGRVAKQNNDQAAVRRFDLNRPLDTQPGKEAYFRDLYDVVRAAGAPDTQKTRQWVANIVDFRDADPEPTTFMLPGGGSVTGAEPDQPNLRWNVGEMISCADLIGVPVDSKDEIDEKLGNNLPLFSLLRDDPEVSEAILEAVEVPARFAATLAQDSQREPGRVNVNTCELQVWQVVAPGAAGRPGRPWRSMWDLLKNVAGGEQDVRSFNRDLANRLASVATVRSNVFAVWITLEVSDSAPEADSPTCHRLFAIVDRSIPADYQEGENGDYPDDENGENRNVRQTIRLKRFLN